mmetsp:Transcript_27661/g.72951  ORF Transcript_27661/g.72951 Transcript_27661/m.72951 type:complete len:106 (+) Transcript_27661:2143-2460(+)
MHKIGRRASAAESAHATDDIFCMPDILDARPRHRTGPLKELRLPLPGSFVSQAILLSSPLVSRRQGFPLLLLVPDVRWVFQCQLLRADSPVVLVPSMTRVMSREV